jgi:hypothetical protein
MANDASQAQVDASSATVFSEQLNKSKNYVAPDKVIETADNLLADVSLAKATEENFNVFPSTTAFLQIIIGGTTYYGKSLYQIRVINAASALVDYISSQRNFGNLDEGSYNSYIENLKAIMDQVNWAGP